ncbi:MAG: peptidase [Gemmatimonadetes bacterium]|jgi:murein DD-endopeptidase MepM/ murein hydrolase activator NlpD|nr:peptidase [Gemmatimonadota bacterium]
MTQARRTPSYVPIIGAEPMGPQLMGPHPAPPPQAPTPAGQLPPRRGSSTILELRPGAAEPHVEPRVEPQDRAQTWPAVDRRAPRQPVVAAERRPLEVLILSAAPGIAPRHLRVARWQIRAVLAGLGTISLLACALVAAVGVAVGNPGLFVPRSSVELIQSELSAAQDSLDALRTAVEEAEHVADSTAAAAAALISRASVSAAPVRARPLRTRATRHTGDVAEAEGSVSLDMSRVISDLPVIGALASRFSLARRHPILRRTRPHLGVDVAAPRGTRVSAPAPGRVKFVGRKVGFGLVVELDHGEGITTRYAHLRSSAVQVGERVTKGEAIAAVGTSGLSTGPHLHYEVLVSGRQVDPLRFRFPDGSVSSLPTPAVAAPTAPASVPAPTSPISAPATPSGVGAGGQDAPPPGSAQQLPR